MLARLKRGPLSFAFSFGLITAVLLLLYAWTLTETVTVAVAVEDGMCTAELGERSSSIPCPKIGSGKLSLYLTTTSTAQKLWYRPLDLLVPGTTWDSVRVTSGDASEEALLLTGREISQNETISWPGPQDESFVIEAHLRRPDGEHAGILLLEPRSSEGWLFVVDSENRQGMWRRWQEGRPLEAVAGVPFRKPLLAQAQSLLWLILATFIGALGFVPTDYWWHYGRFFSSNTPWLDGGIIYARDLGKNNECLRQIYPERNAYIWHSQTNSVVSITTASESCDADQ